MSKNTCGECKHYIAMSRCIFHGQFVRDDDCCDYYAPKPQPITNGDKIQQGGNRALAEFHDKLACDICAYRYDHRCNAPQGKPLTCVDGIEAWLNAPAESETESEGEDDGRTKRKME